MAIVYRKISVSNIYDSWEFVLRKTIKLFNVQPGIYINGKKLNSGYFYRSH